MDDTTSCCDRKSVVLYIPLRNISKFCLWLGTQLHINSTVASYKLQLTGQKAYPLTMYFKDFILSFFKKNHWVEVINQSLFAGHILKSTCEIDLTTMQKWDFCAIAFFVKINLLRHQWVMDFTVVTEICCFNYLS